MCELFETHYIFKGIRVTRCACLLPYRYTSSDSNRWKRNSIRRRQIQDISEGQTEHTKTDKILDKH